MGKGDTKAKVNTWGRSNLMPGFGWQMGETMFCSPLKQRGGAHA